MHVFHHARCWRAGLLSISLLALIQGAACRLETEPQADDAVRVVSLAPSLTEIIMAIGAEAHLIGRSSACNYPSEIVDIPVIGGFGVPSVEALIAASPTVVISTDLKDKALVAQLARYGIDMRMVRCDQVDDIPSAIREIGQLTGYTDQAEALAASILTGIAQRRSRHHATTNRPSVYLEIWHEPPMTVGNESYLHGLIDLAGGHNLASDIEKAYFRPSAEWIVQRNPDVIISLSMDGSMNPERLASRSGWNVIKGVQNGHLHTELDPDTILRPGPRVLEAIDLIAACLQP